MSSSKGDSTDNELPLYGRIIRGVYKSVPQFNFPGTSLPISFVLVTCCSLITIRILANKFFETVLGWPENAVSTDRAVGSIPAITHSSLLCPGLMVALLARKYRPSEHISKGSQAWQDVVNALLQFCTGYMLNDTIFLIYRAQQASGTWIPTLDNSDQLFLIHHTMTTAYMTQARSYKAGHMSAMMCMLVGELSNPLHNLYYMLGIAADMDCCYGPWAQAANSVVPSAFAAIYLLMRVIVAPPVMLYTTYGLLATKDAKENLPLAVRLFWVFMIWAVIIGSIPEIMVAKGILEVDLEVEAEL